MNTDANDINHYPKFTIVTKILNSGAIFVMINVNKIKIRVFIYYLWENSKVRENHRV